MIHGLKKCQLRYGKDRSAKMNISCDELNQLGASVRAGQTSNLEFNDFYSDQFQVSVLWFFHRKLNETVLLHCVQCCQVLQLNATITSAQLVVRITNGHPDCTCIAAFQFQITFSIPRGEC